MIGPALVNGTLAVLTNNFGTEFRSGNAFGNWMKDRCREANLDHCSCHGLRRAPATIASENNGTPHEIMALLANRSIQQAVGYTRTGRNKVLSDSGMAKVMVPIQNMIENVAPSVMVRNGATKTGAK